MLLDNEPSEKRIVFDCGDVAEDVERIRRVLAAHGITASASDAIRLWEGHSSSMHAGWLVLPKSDGALYNDIIDSKTGQPWTLDAHVVDVEDTDA